MIKTAGISRVFTEIVVLLSVFEYELHAKKKNLHVFISATSDPTFGAEMFYTRAYPKYSGPTL
jgi:hypothetical protein